MVKSEHTQFMTAEELDELQKKIANMSPEDLKSFRNSFDPDLMGFCGKEAVDDED